MLFLATFFPTWEGGAGVYDFVGVSKSGLKTALDHVLALLFTALNGMKGFTAA